MISHLLEFIYVISSLFVIVIADAEVDDVYGGWGNYLKKRRQMTKRKIRQFKRIVMKEFRRRLK